MTLTGPGGTGKTRLALQAAADALERVPGRGLARRAGAAGRPGAGAPGGGRGRGRAGGAGRPLATTLAEALRSRRLLLVLDNCEHLLEACARLADALLRACPHLTVLATSREALGIGGETAWPVPPLGLPPPPDARRPPPVEALTQYEAVRLFIDRALAGRPDFAVTNRNAPAVAQICARLDGIPLALELAAARVRVLPPEQLLARLEDRFRLLTGAAAPRSRATRRCGRRWTGATPCSTEPEQALFARLAVFGGGWTLEAAEAVCAGEGVAAAEVLDLLSALVDKSLVVADEQDGAARYRLLETIREYALERLVHSGEATAVQQQHAAHYLALATATAGAILTATARGPEGFDRLEQEHDNLRAALRWLIEHGETEQALRLGTALTALWGIRGYLTEGRDSLARAAGPPRGPGERGHPRGGPRRGGATGVQPGRLRGGAPLLGTEPGALARRRRYRPRR